MEYTKIVFQNSPSTATPLNAENLNHMDDQIALNDQRLTEIETSYVKSFNGRKGEVTPQANDYNMSQITPTNGATAGQIPVVRNDGTAEEPNLTFHMEDVPSSGHTIVDQDGNELTQEPKMKFLDAFIGDNSTDEVTEIENIKEVSPADYASTTDEGIIVTDDGNDALIGAVSDDYVEVTADGDKNYATLLNEIATEMDFSKVRDNAYLATILANGNKNISVLRANYGTSVTFFQGLSESTGAMIRTYYIEDSNSQFEESTGSSYSDKSTTKPTNGTIIRLYYGNKKATVDLQTTANRCLMSDGSTVQSSLDSISNPSRASVSVLTYAVGLSEGIHFYTTSTNTADNPATGSHMFMIFKAATGITVFGMSLASRDAFLNASSNSGNTWSGWKAFSLV